MAGLTVVCMYWEDPHQHNGQHYRFLPGHVALLKLMVDRHLSMPHEFVCITDRPDAFSSGIRTVPLDRSTFVSGRRFAKLQLFKRDAGDLLGERVLYLDLDCVVTGKLEPLVTTDAPVKIWRNPHWGEKKKWAPFNSSMVLLTAGCRPDIYEGFDREKARGIWAGDDQDWVSHCLGADYPHYWTELDGVWNACWMEGARAGGPTKLPKGARITFFPGARIPTQEEQQRIHPWIRKHLPC